MEQRHCVDRTPMSEAQANATDALDDRDLDNAATKLLTVPALPSLMHGKAEAEAGSPTPALADMVNEWSRLQAEMNSREMENEELDTLGEKVSHLQQGICDFDIQCLEDLRLKAAIYRYEGRDARGRYDEKRTTAAHAWESVVRDIDALGSIVFGNGLQVSDPIFALIEQGRRLLAISDAAFAIPVPPKGDTPQWIQEATTKALRDLVDHCRGVLLQTVPQTAAGCQELARFAVEYFEHQEVAISDDEQAVTSLIARSPLLTTPVGPDDPELLALGRKHDEAHTAWREAVASYRDADEQHTAFLEAAKARGGPTMADIIEGEKIPGYKEGCQADEATFGVVGDIGLEILKHRPRSIAGLAVLARALVPHVWPTGTFEEDAALAPDEDMDKEAVRHMIEACCAAAGVRWDGRPAHPAAQSDAFKKQEVLKPDMGRVPCPEDAHPDAYGLTVNEGGAGAHAPPGSTVIVEPIPPAPRDLAVAYMKKGGTPSIWHIGDSFTPDLLNYHPDSEVFPQIELFDPVTGRHGYIDCRKFEKLHRVQGVYVPVDVAQAFGPAPADLPILGETPEGCIEHLVRDACNYPVLRTNDVALVDIGKTELTHGALCLIRWDGNGDHCGIMQTNFRKMGSAGPVWVVDPINRPRGPGMLERRQKAGGLLWSSDGPYSEEALQPKIVGQVVGILEMERRVPLGGQI